MSENQENLPAKSELGAQPAQNSNADNPGQHSLNQSSILQNSQIAIHSHQSFSGPLPPPALLQQYNLCVPDGANRIIRMAEAEGEHRRSMERMALEKTFTEGTRGQYCAAFIATFGIAGAIYLGSIGSAWAASIVGGSSLAIIVLAFLKARQPENEPTPPPPPARRKKTKR